MNVRWGRLSVSRLARCPTRQDRWRRLLYRQEANCLSGDRGGHQSMSVCPGRVVPPRSRTLEKIVTHSGRLPRLKTFAVRLVKVVRSAPFSSDHMPSLLQGEGQAEGSFEKCDSSATLAAGQRSIRRTIFRNLGQNSP